MITGPILNPDVPFGAQSKAAEGCN